MFGWQFYIQNQLNTFHIPDPVCSELCTAGDSLSLPLHLQWHKRAGIWLMKDLCPGLCLGIKSTCLFHIINAQRHTGVSATPMVLCRPPDEINGKAFSWQEAGIGVSSYYIWEYTERRESIPGAFQQIALGLLVNMTLPVIYGVRTREM